MIPISYYLDLKDDHQVDLIPKVTAGFEGMPTLPRIDLWPRLFTNAILIAFICYALTYSVEQMYARKNGYEVHPNQEVVALGLTNLVSSFFLCFPSAAGLARTAVQDKVGGKTQIASIISSGLIVIVILFLSQFLALLPKCALACIIVVALLSTFKKFYDLVRFWKISKLDGLLWAVSFLLVTFLGVDQGLIYSLGIGIALLIYRLAM